MRGSLGYRPLTSMHNNPIRVSQRYGNGEDEGGGSPSHPISRTLHARVQLHFDLFRDAEIFLYQRRRHTEHSQFVPTDQTP